MDPDELLDLFLNSDNYIQTEILRCMIRHATDFWIIENSGWSQNTESIL